MNKDWLRILRNLAVAATFVTLALSQDLAKVMLPRNRFLLHWELIDGVARVLSVALPAIAMTVVYEFARRQMAYRWVRALHVLFLTGLTFFAGDYWLTPCLMEWLHPHRGMGWLVLWVPLTLLYAVAGICSIRWRRQLVNVMMRVVLCFSPIVVLLMVQFLTFRTWGGDETDVSSEFTDGRAPDFRAAGNGPVLLVILDGWSVQRSLAGDGRSSRAGADGEVSTMFGPFLPNLRNLNALAHSAIFLPNARSPGDRTERSVLPMLMAKRGGMVVAAREAYWTNENSRVACSTIPTIFDEARVQGYSPFMFGFHLPYRHILGGKPGVIWSPPYEIKAGSPLAKVSMVYFRAALDVRYPPLFHMLWHLRQYRVTRYWRQNHDRVHAYYDRTLAWVRQAPPRSFIVLHAPFTHAPFTTQADLSMQPLSGDEPLWGSPEGYMRGLSLADRFVGELVEAWKESGRYENATIILTADHSWRDDTAPATISEPEWKRRVPLIVKCPGQRAGRIASTRFETINMVRILRLAFAGCADEGSVLTEINAAR